MREYRMQGGFMSTRMGSTKSWIISGLLLLAVICNIYEVAASEDDAAQVIEKEYYSLVLFGSEDCARCKDILKMLAGLSSQITEQAVKIINVQDPQLSKKYGVHQIPEVLYFRDGVPLRLPVEELQAEDIVSWLQQHRDLKMKSLNDDSFEHLTQASTGATTGDWFIMFYEPTCKELLSIMETVADRMSQKINVAMVDVSRNKGVKKRFDVQECPQLMFLRQGNKYHYGRKSHDLQAVLSFADGGYKHEKAWPIVQPSTPFDTMTDQVVSYIKRIASKSQFGLVPTVLAVMLVIAVMFGYLCSRNKHHDKHE